MHRLTLSSISANVNLSSSYLCRVFKSEVGTSITSYLNNLRIRKAATMIKDKPVRIIAISDVSHELSNQEIDSWIKLIRVLTHEIMNTITPVTSLSETLLKELEEDMHWEGRFATCPNSPKEKDMVFSLL